MPILLSYDVACLDEFWMQQWFSTAEDEFALRLLLFCCISSGSDLV
jgi:hypothetical protein